MVSGPCALQTMLVSEAMHPKVPQYTLDHLRYADPPVLNTTCHAEPTSCGHGTARRSGKVMILSIVVSGCSLCAHGRWDDLRAGWLPTVGHLGWGMIPCDQHAGRKWINHQADVFVAGSWQIPGVADVKSIFSIFKHDHRAMVGGLPS